MTLTMAKPRKLDRKRKPPEAPAICHALDAAGLSICGAELKGTRPSHRLEHCEHENHDLCLVCDEMQSLGVWDLEQGDCEPS